ncbi:MAG: hypothetical protein V4539_05055 [Bacteroidota bacterium]
MTPSNQSAAAPWPLWQKIFFRFFFIYFTLNIVPWTWLGDIPGFNYVADYYGLANDWLVELCNNLFFHYPKTTIVNNGSGDTSIAWEQMYTYLLFALSGALVWSVIDRKRRSYARANYWLRTFVRYFIIMNCFSYGINKLYALQMSFPLQSQLATPLGDFLPMRFSWMFIGYSKTYEMFSGAMEVLAGLLLLNRRTITLGLFTATVVFINVMILNLCYDIPVKLYSMHLVAYCLYLLSNDCKRLIDFFVLNKAVAANHIHENHLSKKWMRITRIVLKLAFIGLFFIKDFFTMNDYYQTRELQNATEAKPIRSGIYDVVTYVINKDTIAPVVTDTTRWRDLIIEKGNFGSVGSTDTAFRQRYRRGYFNIVPDSALQTVNFKRSAASQASIASLHYAFPDSNTVKLWGSKGKDSIYILLKRSNRHFQLAEKQFHWISEANR